MWDFEDRLVYQRALRCILLRCTSKRLSEWVPSPSLSKLLTENTLGHWWAQTHPDEHLQVNSSARCLPACNKLQS